MATSTTPTRRRSHRFALPASGRARIRRRASLALVLLLAGCAQPVSPVPSSSAPTSSPSPTPSVVTPTPTPTPTPPSVEDKVHALVATLTPEQKAGQLIVVEWNRGRSAVDDIIDEAASIDAGGVLYLGTGWTVEKTAAASASLADLVPIDGVRPFIAMDQEGGEIQRMGGVAAIPSALEQGTWPVADLQNAAASWADQLVQAGVNLNLAPVADTVPADMVSQNAPIGELDRQFGSDPQQVGEHAAAFVAGMSSGGVLTSLKHFPGLGRVTENTDFATSGIEDDVTSADDPYLDAFRLGIAAGPGMVMISSAVYTQIDPDHQAMFSSAVITDLLRGRLGWQGVVIGDSMNAASVSTIPAGQRAVDFISAGGDLMTLQTSDDLVGAHQAIIAQMAASPGFTAQVDASVARLLLAKHRVGLADV